MLNLLETLNDPRLQKHINTIDRKINNNLVPKYHKRIVHKYPEYDPTFLWLLMLNEKYSEEILGYIDTASILYKDVLDKSFVKKLAEAGRFQSHMWELIICDIISQKGQLGVKNEGDVDFILHTSDKTCIQVEAVVPEEADDIRYQSVKPNYNSEGFSSHSGNVEDLEKPTLLRFLHAFDKKAGKQNYSRKKPLILAINTNKSVGYTSRDNYILRRALFGLGCETISKNPDDTFRHGLEKRFQVEKHDGSFLAARFLDKNYSHISGVIYSSEPAHTLIKGGTGWNNSGITFVPNPIALNPVTISFPFMHSIILKDDQYEEIGASESFLSSVKTANQIRN